MPENLTAQELHDALCESGKAAVEHVKNNPVHADLELPDILTPITPHT